MSGEDSPIARDNHRDDSHQPPTYHSTSLTERVVTAVTDAADTSPDELGPLYAVVDPEALDRLFAPTTQGDTRTDGHVTFAYAGYQVTVTSDCMIELDPLDEERE
ncbi:HalOD1 output domain-containing protein [Haladaptatus salinisoli]|uniref:HalOD1 output domain-containing protein n=1 Tax=Haladaptatus salinisoli TaxID=2884876 RepID=UPI001D0A1150|nr:HalOD1 output domain-containing protein [Haladaptatus salinisoli]